MRFAGTVNQNSTVTLNGNAATQSSPTQFTGQVNVTNGTNTVTVVARDTSSLATTKKRGRATFHDSDESLRGLP